VEKVNVKKAVKLIGILVAMVVTVPLFALPAQAATPVGTAQLVNGGTTVLSGDTNNAFTIRVTNTGGLQGASVNEVQVLAPISGFTLVDAVAPSGWQVTWNQSTGRVFFTGSTIGSGNGVQANPSADFLIHANVLRQAADTSRNWSVLLSSDGGDSFGPATTTGNGLTTAIKVLKVVGVTLTAPAGVTDNTVTENQAVTVQETVQNAGSAALSVTPSLSSGDISPNPATAPAAQSIPSTGQATFTFSNVTFGAKPSDGHKASLAGGATAPGANALGSSSSQITIMSKAAFNYVPNSLQPKDVVPGHAYQFQLSVSKTGDVGGTLSSATLQFGPGFSAALDPSTVTTIGQGNGTYLLKFATTTVATTIPDGNYTPSLTLAGTDENSAAIAATPGITDQLNLDRLAPVVSPTLTPPASNVQGATPAASNGKSNTLGGSITDGSGNAACANCTITGAFVREFNAGGGTVKDDPVTVTNSGGTMSGTFSTTFNTATTAIQLFVTAADKAGNSTQGVSATVPVDQIDPALSSALTGGGPGTSDTTRIDVFLTELVTTKAMLPSDWNVLNHTVTNAAPAAPQTLAGFDHVILTLSANQPLGGDETPSVQYSPSQATRASDRVALPLDNKAVTAADGIVPGLPTITSVSGHSKQADGYYTNDTQPKFAIGSVADGETVKVYRDNDGNGVVSSGDTLLGQATATGSTATVTSSNLGTIDQTFQFLVVALDTAGNIGQAASDTLHLDFTVPTISTASASGGVITLTFSEAVLGANHAADWYASGSTAGAAYNFGIGSISGSGISRAATISDANYSSSSSTLTSVTYDVQSEAGRFADAAGNPLSNFTKSL
jgi:hypothetical protein